MMSIQDRPLDRWRLHQVLRHMSRAKIRAAGFGAELGLHIDALAGMLAVCKREKGESSTAWG